MHPTLKVALDTANAVAQKLTAGNGDLEIERTRLNAMTKEELIEEILATQTKKRKDAKVEDLVYAIMCTPECAALSYAMIAAVVVKYRPGKTNEKNISWYASKAIEKGHNTVPRVTQKELNRMLMASIE